MPAYDRNMGDGEKSHVEGEVKFEMMFTFSKNTKASVGRHSCVIRGEP